VVDRFWQNTTHFETAKNEGEFYGLVNGIFSEFTTIFYQILQISGENSKF